MNACIVTYEFPPEVTSGFSRTAYNLVDYLSNENNKVTVVTSSEKRDTLIVNKNLTIIYLPRIKNLSQRVKRLFFLKELDKFFNSYNPGRFDIIHFLDAHESYCINNKFKKTRVIISVNEYYSFIGFFGILKYPCSFLEKSLRLFYHPYLKYLNKKYLPQADMVVCNSRYLKGIVQKGAGIEKNKLRLVYKGIDTSLFRPGRITGKYNSKKILFVGNNLKRKGLIYLLRALKNLKNMHPSVQLIIVSKEAGKKITDYIKKNNLNRVLVLTNCGEKKLVRLYQEANVFLMPSVLENIAQTLMEALATATPVICTDVGSNKELVNNEVGILIRPKKSCDIARAVNFIFKDALKAKKLGFRGRKMIMDKFNKKNMSKSYYEIYKECLKK
ncbi:glycosyltransferase family 4 protein [Candidatus Woesearchaeota archaeon]|nr:glycosyltransferase family 4 protein [Candidatus Woesearchaeota archaeon]